MSVDVREPTELALTRVKGAKHIPLGQLKGRLGERDRERPTAFLCGSGIRSAMTPRAAAKAGLDAANLTGGVSAWSRAGLPLLTGSQRGVA